MASSIRLQSQLHKGCLVSCKLVRQARLSGRRLPAPIGSENSDALIASTNDPIVSPFPGATHTVPNATFDMAHLRGKENLNQRRTLRAGVRSGLQRKASTEVDDEARHASLIPFFKCNMRRDSFMTSVHLLFVFLTPHYHVIGNL